MVRSLILPPEIHMEYKIFPRLGQVLGRRQVVRGRRCGRLSRVTWTGVAMAAAQKPPSISLYRPSASAAAPTDTFVYPHDDRYAFRPYQHAIVQSALRANTLVSLPTGTGKTRLGDRLVGMRGMESRTGGGSGARRCRSRPRRTDPRAATRRGSSIRMVSSSDRQSSSERRR